MQWVFVMVLISGFILFHAGGCRDHASDVWHPTKTHLLTFCDIRLGTLDPRTCSIFSEMGRGSTQEPPCRPFDMSIFSALLSQSGITFDQLCMVLLHQNLPQSKDVESLLRTEVHAGSTIFPVSF